MDRSRRRTVTWRVGMLAVLVGLLVVLGFLGGCRAQDTGGPEPEAEREAQESPTGDADAGSAEGRLVFMMGRSVMSEWFSYWGWDRENPVERGGYAFTYLEVPGPPEIAEEAVRYVESAPDGSIVFFKLCFADFWAAAPQEADANARELLGYVERVIDAAQGRDITLVVGNALPRVRAEATRDIVDLQKRYNEGVEALASGHGNVVVFDMYQVLAEPSGELRAQYAIAPDDSHLSGEAYEVLETALLELLGTAE